MTIRTAFELPTIQCLAAVLALFAAVDAGAQTSTTAQSGDIQLVSSSLGAAVVQEPSYRQPISPDQVANSNSYPQGDFYNQLSSAGGESACGSCGSHWGCGGSPFRTGPGKCDTWRVGPVWRTTFDGVFMTREETDLAPLAASIGTTLAAAEQFENFEHSGGVRLSAAGWWPQMKGYEMQIGYLGLFDWDASVVAPAAAVAVPPAGSVALTEQRTLDYESQLHSFEINTQRTTSAAWKPYFGFRYLLFEEEIYDRNDQFATAPLGLGDISITNDTLIFAEIENHLVGFQLGARRDVWNITQKLSLQGFTSGGIFCNLIDRDQGTRQTQTRTEVLAVDDPITPDFNEIGSTTTLTTQTGTRVKTERAEFAFVGETSVTVIYKVNRCAALRGGYQALYINGVELADQAYLGLAPTSEDMLIHGWFAGFEYRR